MLKYRLFCKKSNPSPASKLPMPQQIAENQEELDSVNAGMHVKSYD